MLMLRGRCLATAAISLLACLPGPRFLVPAESSESSSSDSPWTVALEVTFDFACPLSDRKQTEIRHAAAHWLQQEFGESFRIHVAGEGDAPSGGRLVGRWRFTVDKQAARWRVTGGPVESGAGGALPSASAPARTPHQIPVVVARLVGQTLAPSGRVRFTDMQRAVVTLPDWWSLLPEGSGLARGACFQLFEQNTDGTLQNRPWDFLVAEETQGAQVSCRVATINVARHQRKLVQRHDLIAIPIRPRPAELHLQMVLRKSQRALPGCSVFVGRQDYDDSAAAWVGRGDVQGRFRFRDRVGRLSYVTLAKQGVALARFPLVAALHAEPLRIELPEPSTKKRHQDRFYLEHEILSDLTLAWKLIGTEVETLIEAESLEEAKRELQSNQYIFQRAGARLKQLDVLEKQASDDGVDLSSQIATLRQQATAALSDGPGRLLQQIESILETRRMQQQIEKLSQQAFTAEQEFRIDDALQHLRDILKLDPNDKAARARLAQLEQAWRSKGKTHQQAREWIVSLAASADGFRPQDDIERLDQTIDTLIKYGDHLTLQHRAAQAFSNLLKILERQLEFVKKQEGDRQQEITTIEEHQQRLVEIQGKVTEYLVNRRGALRTESPQPE